MSTLQTPFNNQNQSLVERIKKFSQRLITPHPSVQELGLVRRAQLLNGFTLLLIVAFTLGLLARPQSVIIFNFLLGISVVSFLLGKSKFPSAGTLFFSLGFISVTYLSLFLGLAPSYLTSVLAVVPIALIIASALTSQRTFAGLAVYATIMPYKIAPTKNMMPLASGTSFVLISDFE